MSVIKEIEDNDVGIYLTIRNNLIYLKYKNAFFVKIIFCTTASQMLDLTYLNEPIHLNEKPRRINYDLISVYFEIFKYIY